MPEGGGGGLFGSLLGIFELFSGSGDESDHQVTCQQMQAMLNNFGIDRDLQCNVNPTAGIQTAREDSTELLGVVIDELGNELDGFTRELDTQLNNFVQGGNNVLGGIESSVVDILDGLFGGTDSDIGRIASDILQNIGNTSQGAILNIEGLTNQVIGNIDLNATTAIEVITGLFGISNQNINELLRDSRGFLESITQEALDSIEETLGFSVEQFEDIFDNVGEAMILNLTNATEQNALVSEKVIEGLDEQLEQSRLNAEAARGDMSAAIEAITGESESALATTREVLEETGEAQAEATTEGAEQVSESVTGGFGSLTESISDLAHTALVGADPETRDKVKDAINSAVDLTGCPPDAAPIIQAFISELFGTFSLLGSAAQAQLSLASFQTFIGPVLEVFSNCISQAAARAIPTALPDASTLRDQVNRRMLPRDEAVNVLMSQGFSLDRALQLIEQRQMLPDIGLIQTWFLRGFIDTDTTIGMLADLGLKDQDIENTIQMSFFIPPVQDLITMMVREAFNDDIVREFGQLQEFPQEFVQYAQQQGISEFWAQKYWASHWQMPSFGMANEMLQRGIINDDTWDTLVRAHDFTPFWRPLLKELQYKPLTRVDVRRMHDLGLLSDEDLIRRYQDVGFSRANADMMAQFTIAYNNGGDAEDVGELVGVTRSMALKLFREGALTREQTEDVLLDQGMSQQAADILIENELVELEISERKEQTKLIIEQAKAGTLTFDQAHDELGALGLEPTELTRALTTLERARASATKIPTRADADRFIKNGVINSSQYLDLVQRNGYSEFWARKYLDAVEASD